VRGARRAESEHEIARLMSAAGYSLADVIRSLPEHFFQAGGKILRFGLAGCATAGNLVPSQGHLISADAVFVFKFFIAIISWIRARWHKCRCAEWIARCGCPI
jgi:hypothetical protein